MSPRAGAPSGRPLLEGACGGRVTFWRAGRGSRPPDVPCGLTSRRAPTLPLGAAGGAWAGGDPPVGLAGAAVAAAGARVGGASAQPVRALSPGRPSSDFVRRSAGTAGGPHGRSAGATTPGNGVGSLDRRWTVAALAVRDRCGQQAS